MEDLVRWVSWFLIGMAVVNVVFLVTAYRTFRAVSPPSPILRALFGVGLIVWLASVYIAFLAYRFLAGLPPFPLGGLLLGICLLAMELLPAFIWLEIRSFTSSSTAREEARDLARDIGRDTIRDSVRDTARDAEVALGGGALPTSERDENRDAGRDIGRDPIRDAARDTARDAEQADES